MENFKEIKLDEIAKYKDPFSLFSSRALAASSSKKGSNALTIGWGGIGTLFSLPCCTIYINKKRYSKIIFDEADYFSVCFFNDEYNEVLDKFYGTLSGKDVDKMNNGPLKVIDIDGVPAFKEAELIIICKMMAKSDFDVDKIYIPRIESWYRKDGVHTIYHGQIIKVYRKDK